MVKSSNPKIIAGIPAYNMGKYIGTMVLNIRKYVDEVIVVDNGSTDNTSEIARLAGAEVVQYTEKKGYGTTIQNIITEARKKDPDILVMLDADTHNDPREIPKIIKPVQDGYDFVIGYRESQNGKIPFYHRLGQNGVLRFMNSLSEKRLADTECGFQAFSRKAISILELREDGTGVSDQTVAEVVRQDLKVVEVPILFVFGNNHSNHRPSARRLGLFNRLLVMISEGRPLFFFGIAGTILIALGVIAGARVLQLFTASSVLPIGTTTIAVFFLVIGVFSIFTGLTLHGLSRRSS